MQRQSVRSISARLMLVGMISLHPSGNLNSSQFGKITGASDMRQMQFGIRLTF